MNGPWPGRGQTNADFAREFGVAARHECRHLLVRHRDELHAITRTIKGAENAIDAIAGIPVNPRDPPVTETLD
jgi:hypothetical protein